MPQYEFQNPVTGERRTVFATMRHPPPERIVFHDKVAQHEGDLEYLYGPASEDRTKGVWHRVYEVPQICAEPSDHKGYPFYSNTLPRKLPGCECDSIGRPMVKSPQHAKAIGQYQGFAQVPRETLATGKTDNLPRK